MMTTRCKIAIVVAVAAGAVLVVSCSLIVDVADLEQRDADAGDDIAEADVQNADADGDASSTDDGAEPDEAADQEGEAGEATPADDGVGPEDGGAEDGDVDDSTPGPCPSGWLDPTTNLCWENPVRYAGPDSFAASEGYCAGLATAEGVPWRLPTIDELRTLVRGCADTASDGSCRLSEACSTYSTCFAPGECDYCESMTGPGPGGCYSPESFTTGSCGWAWSSTFEAVLDRYWGLSLGNAAIYAVEPTCNPGDCNTRCVRAIEP